MDKLIFLCICNWRGRFFIITKHNEFFEKYYICPDLYHDLLNSGFPRYIDYVRHVEKLPRIRSIYCKKWSSYAKFK